MRPALKRVIAAAELLLIFPAALFMTALFARNLQPPQLEPAHTAQQIVLWYSGRLHFGLYVLLMTMPLIVLVMGCATLLRAVDRMTLNCDRLRSKCSPPFARIWQRP
jgi:hypothetical protein